jgi:hypothetical protein
MRKLRVSRAVALIGPDEHLRTECVNAVHIALIEIVGTDADLRRMFLSRTKRGKRAAHQLEKTLQRLRDVLNDTNIPESLRSLFPAKKHPDPDVFVWPQNPRYQQVATMLWLKLWMHRAESVRSKTGRPKFHFAAEKKLIAAEQAHSLLQQFDRDISVSKGSTFCRLAALLHGTPKANFQRPCWTVLRSAAGSTNVEPEKHT